MGTVIKVEDIYKIYSEGDTEVRAVDGVSLEIHEGEFTAIVGPSGSGKTTLLNLIGGLDHPTSGSVHINGTDISELSDNEMIDFRLKNIGFVFQAYNLLPVLTAEENTGFIMQLQKRSKKEIKSRVHKLMADVGLEDRMHHRPSEMSGGQQQRVAVARALASKPAFILADEPTANLDSSSTNNLLDIMARLNREEKMTFIFSTHDQRVIDKARRIIRIDDGKIISDETDPNK
jgi:putative ABC transport system ATP-binding protein